MLTDKGNIVISPVPASKSEDYEWLRTQGLNYIQQFSGKLWTDYNVHDPGITIHELLCYALTDLAYRTAMPVADLLTPKDGTGPNPNDFYTAKKALTTHPVTINDYRKLILDRVPGIRNVWMETLDDEVYEPNIYFDEKLKINSLTKPAPLHPSTLLKLKGRYAVKLETEDFEIIKSQHPHFLRTLAKNRNAGSLKTAVEADKTEFGECLENYVKKLLYSSRNLCEDFENISIAGEELVAVCADIELKPDANADSVFLEINNLLYNYINPTLRFYSFSELIQKGKRTEDIFNGAVATRGFINDDELANHGHKEVLYVSDIISLIMDLPGVLQVKKIHLSSYRQKTDGTHEILSDAQQYCLHLKDKINNVFRFALDVAEQDKTKIFNHIKFSKGLIYFTPKRLAEYAGLSFIDYPALPKDFENDLPIPSGTNRASGSYYSIQNDFPLCYYAGQEGVPNSETVLRKAQRLQLKAYLLFFDQLLADYLANLDNAKNLFSWTNGTGADMLVAGRLDNAQVKDLNMLLASSGGNYDATYTSYAKDVEPLSTQQHQRSKALDHLLARFNEVFADYSVFKFRQNAETEITDGLITAETIQDKIRFLQAYPIISGKRSHAFDYTKKYLNTTNLCGLQLRIAKMLGLTGSTNKSLVKPLNSVNYHVMLSGMLSGTVPSDSDILLVEDNRTANFDSNFGIHILEHILLRPLYKKHTVELNKLLTLCGNDSNNEEADCILPDRYSMQLSVVLPGWLAVSATASFRAFTENLIRTEAPAHVALKICWLTPAQMYLFEKTTDLFFHQMAKIKKPGANITPSMVKEFNAALSDVNSMLSVLKNMYLPSALNECEEINYNAETEEIKVPVILNHSALGGHAAVDWYKFSVMNEVVAPPNRRPTRLVTNDNLESVAPKRIITKTAATPKKEKTVLKTDLKNKPSTAKTKAGKANSRKKKDEN